MPTSFALAALAILTTVVASTAAAPASGACTVSGVVTDPMGGLVKDVRIVLIDGAGKEKAKVKTDETGRYRTKPVPCGDYELQASAMGFVQAKDRVTLAGDDTHDLPMKLGSIYETVLVTNSGPGEEGPLVAPPGHACKRAFVAGGPGGAIDPPTKLKDVSAAYSWTSEQMGVTGSAVIHGVVGVDGSVSQLVVQSATRDEFAKAALAAVAGWRFDPVRLNCTPQETALVVEFNFGQRR